MTLGDLVEMLDSGQAISDYSNYELVLPDGFSILSVTVDDENETICLSDTADAEGH